MNLSQGDYFSLMEDDNDGFKKSSPLLSPAQKPSACIFQLVSPLLKDPWTNCWIFINQLNLMRWKDLFKRMKKGETDTENSSNAFPWKNHFLPRFLGRAYSVLFPGNSSSSSFWFSHTCGLRLAMFCFYYYYFLKQADSYKEELMRVEGGKYLWERRQESLSW